MHSAFQFNQYLLRRQVFALTGKLRLYDPMGQLQLYTEQKMFALKENIRVYSDESKSQELLMIQARQIMDFAASYDVIDSLSQQKVGVWRRKGLRSLLQDSWELLDANDRPMAVMKEDNMTLALIRRFIAGSWLPQNYDILAGEDRLVDLKQRFNLFRYELDIDFSMDQAQKIDKRLGIAGGILLAIIEGKQSS